VRKVARKAKFSRIEADRALLYIEPRLEGYRTFRVCGSYRRNLPTVGDLDIAIVPLPDVGLELLQKSIKKMSKEVLANGNKILRVIIPIHDMYDIQVDFYFTPERILGSFSLFLTGSKDFNKKSRFAAQRLGMRLSQYGLIGPDGLEVSVNEGDILNILGLSRFMNPETRSL